MNEQIYHAIYKSPVGDLQILCTEEALLSLGVQGEQESSEIFEENALIRQIKREMDQYFAGKRKEFTIPLDMRGTEFQKKVWQALREIPYGETCTYKEIAEKIGNPKACRAVGMANHCNPIGIVVPCHRVIGADGRLTGYAGGLAMKEPLLQLEAKFKK